MEWIEDIDVLGGGLGKERLDWEELDRPQVTAEEARAVLEASPPE